MKHETIVVYRSLGNDPRHSEWRWWWKARNGRIIAASTEGYSRRCDAIANLEHITGDRVVLKQLGGGYSQGWLARGDHEPVFVGVHR